MKRLDQIISIASLTAAAAAAFATTNAAAQTYPARQILMVVPLQAGTAVDNVARTLAQRMTQSMGQTIVVENQAGAAAGRVLTNSAGTPRTAQAAPFKPHNADTTCPPHTAVSATRPVTPPRGS